MRWSKFTCSQLSFKKLQKYFKITLNLTLSYFCVVQLFVHLLLCFFCVCSHFKVYQIFFLFDVIIIFLFIFETHVHMFYRCSVSITYELINYSFFYNLLFFHFFWLISCFSFTFFPLDFIFHDIIVKKNNDIHYL